MATSAKQTSVVTAFEAKTRFGSLLRRVAEGEEIIITRHDMPVARIVPEANDRKARNRLAMEGLAALRARMAGRPDYVPPTDEEILSAIAEGRY